MTARILVLPGTPRPGAPSVRLAGEATRLLAMTDVALTSASLADYPMPLLEDDEAGEAEIPQNAKLLAQRFALQDGLLVVAPAINAGIPPLLKNALDWTARVSKGGERPMRPFHRLVVALASAGPDEGGGRLGLVPLRAVFQSLGAEVLTRECHLPNAGAGFESDGRLANAGVRAALDDLVEALLDHTRALGRQI